jgi:hypothetical protein
MSYAETVAEILLASDSSAQVRILELPGLPPKGDAFEFIHDLRHEGSAEEVCKEITLLADAAPVYQSPRQSTDALPERRYTSAAEVRDMQFPEPMWVVPELIPIGLTLFVGKPKVGKSWGCLQLGIAIATGGMAFGTINVERGLVLYLALEDSFRRLQSRLTRINDAWPENLVFQTVEDAPAWKLGNGFEEVLVTFLDEHPDTKLVMVDTLQRIRPRAVGSGNSYDFDYDHMAVLHAIAHKYSIGLVAVHHTRKQASRDDVFEEVSGTTALTGAADTILMLGSPRQQADGTLDVTGRDIEERTLLLSKDHDTQTWHIVGDGDTVEITPARNEIVEHLRNNGPQTPAEIAKGIGKDDSDSTRKLLKGMREKGQVIREQDGKYSIPRPAEDDSIADQ